MPDPPIPPTPVLCLALDAFGPPAGDNPLAAYAVLAEGAERAGFDLLLTGYGGAAAPRLDALSLAAALMPVTKAVGLVARIDASGWAPFNVARALASFDLLAHGRTGWLADPGADADQPERFAEHLDVVFALLDSWRDDALVFDKENAVFADRERVHRIRHVGRHFTVDGPLNAPRPPQGRPVMLQAVGAAPSPADIAISRARIVEDAAAERERIHAPLMILDFAVSLSGAPLPDTEGSAWRGPAAALVDLMDAWLQSGLVDGFNILPAAPAEDLDVLAYEVLPALRARGMLPARPEGGDLRTRLGLARPANRFAPPIEGVLR